MVEAEGEETVCIDFSRNKCKYYSNSNMIPVKNLYQLSLSVKYELLVIGHTENLRNKKKTEKSNNRKNVKLLSNY